MLHIYIDSQKDLKMRSDINIIDTNMADLCWHIKIHVNVGAMFEGDLNEHKMILEPCLMEILMKLRKCWSEHSNLSLCCKKKKKVIKKIECDFLSGLLEGKWK